MPDGLRDSGSADRSTQGDGSLGESRVEAVTDWLRRIFGPDVTASQHEDVMRDEDWKHLAETVIRIGDEAGRDGMTDRGRPTTPEERLIALRRSLHPAEIPAVLFTWMEAVELQLAALREQVNETATTAHEARMFGPRPIG